MICGGGVIALAKNVWLMSNQTLHVEVAKLKVHCCDR